MDRHYTRTAKNLHWLTALLIFGLLGLGFYMVDLPFSPDKLKLYSWHKWAGVTVFVLTVARLGWRIGHPPPPAPAGMGAWSRRLAQGGHAALYLLMLGIPLSGWIMGSAKGVPTVWFGVLPLPDLVERNRALGDLMQSVHANLNLVLIALVAGHMAAALKHHFIDRDDVLRRMLPTFASEK